jgi:hypothetical protein
MIKAEVVAVAVTKAVAVATVAEVVDIIKEVAVVITKAVVDRMVETGAAIN